MGYGVWGMGYVRKIIEDNPCSISLLPAPYSSLLLIIINHFVVGVFGALGIGGSSGTAGSSGGIG